MKPIPDPIATRWRPMWHPNAHPERPWWRAKEIGVTVRVDGLLLVMYDAMGLYPNAMHLPHDEDVDEALARIDAEHPLPAPPPMPGQVWAKHEETRTERHIDGVMVTPDGYVYVVWSGDDPGHMHIARGTLWPPPGAILVAGPTPWGRDVPWSPK